MVNLYPLFFTLTLQTFPKHFLYIQKLSHLLYTFPLNTNFIFPLYTLYISPLDT